MQVDGLQPLLIVCRIAWSAAVITVFAASSFPTVPRATAETGRAAQREWQVFDIPGQPLADALDLYARLTGRAALVDQERVVNRRAATVRGLFTRDEALRVLLAGTGLSVRYVGSDAFTLAPSDAAIGSRGPGERPSLQRNGYFAAVQAALVDALCRQAETEPGGYRLAVQLWFSPSGTVRALHLLDSTGDVARDAAISRRLEAIAAGEPPLDVPQPVTIALMPRPAGAASDCHRGGESRE
jgi:hypothetical protein